MLPRGSKNTEDDQITGAAAGTSDHPWLTSSAGAPHRNASCFSLHTCNHFFLRGQLRFSQGGKKYIYGKCWTLVHTFVIWLDAMLLCNTAFYKHWKVALRSQLCRSYERASCVRKNTILLLGLVVRTCMCMDFVKVKVPQKITPSNAKKKNCMVFNGQSKKRWLHYELHPLKNRCIED